MGIGRVVAEGGMRGAVERRRQVLEEGVDRDEGRFCDVLCIIGDQYVSLSLLPLFAPTQAFGVILRLIAGISGAN